MKEILVAIEQKKQKFAQLPFFEFMRDESIPPEQRLGFSPCIAPFIMSFGELNRCVFREEPTDNKIQKIINHHTYEDDNHWLWFIEDFKKLGFDHSMNYTDALKFLWSEETQTSRKLARKLYEYTFRAEPLQKLVVITVVEATGNVFLSASTKVVQQLQDVNQTKYVYFGENHLDVDEAHGANSPEIDRVLQEISVNEATLQKYFVLVEKTFELFEEFTYELLAYAQAHNSDKTLQVA